MAKWTVSCALGALAAGCGAATDVQLRKLLHEREVNEIAAVDSYLGEWLRFSGVVEEVGIKKQDEVHHELSGFSYAWSGDSKRVQRQYAFAVLRPEDGGKGKALCFFNPDDRSDAAELRQGTFATLQGYFREYGDHNRETVVVLHGCTRD